MLAFYDPDSELHRPLHRIAGGELRPTYETAERIGMLSSALNDMGVQIRRPTIAEPDVRAAIARVHDADYLDFLENGFHVWSQDPANGPELRTSIHTSRLMGRRPDNFLGRAGYYQADSSAVLCEGTWQSALASVRTTLAALDAATAGAHHAYALCRPPGHHAYCDQAGGFCYLNNAAIAAAAAAANGARVAILDVDVHHGNGTQHIFYERADVLTVSIHADPAQAYPFYAGYGDETGAGEGEGANVNLPLALGSDLPVYLEAMNAARRRITDHAPDILVISLGLDAYRGDPFACMALEAEDFTRIGAACDFGVPTVLVQEGGYPSPGLGQVLARFLAGLTG